MVAVTTHSDLQTATADMKAPKDRDGKIVSSRENVLEPSISWSMSSKERHEIWEPLIRFQLLKGNLKNKTKQKTPQNTKQPRKTPSIGKDVEKSEPFVHCW